MWAEALQSQPRSPSSSLSAPPLWLVHFSALEKSVPQVHIRNVSTAVLLFILEGYWPPLSTSGLSLHHLILLTTFEGRYYYFSVTHEKTEICRGEATLSKRVAEGGSKPRNVSDSSAHTAGMIYPVLSLGLPQVIICTRGIYIPDHQGSLCKAPILGSAGTAHSQWKQADKPKAQVLLSMVWRHLLLSQGSCLSQWCTKHLISLSQTTIWKPWMRWEWGHSDQLVHHKVLSRIRTIPRLGPGLNLYRNSCFGGQDVLLLISNLGAFWSENLLSTEMCFVDK